MVDSAHFGVVIAVQSEMTIIVAHLSFLREVGEWGVVCSFLLR